MAKRTRYLLLATLVAVLIAASYGGPRLAGLGSAFTAKYLCSEINVGGRDEEEVARIDLPAFRSSILRMVSWHMDDATATVTADIAGIGRRQAVYRPGLGCTLAIGGAPAKVAAAALPSAPDAERFPPPAVAPIGMLEVVADAFTEPDPTRPRRTRALLVIVHGHTLVERYAPGYTAESSFNGWSMSKSALSALVGVLVGAGRLRLDAPLSVPEWTAVDDPRRAITLDQMLHMSSGLEFDEDYDNPLSDVVWMLYGTGDSSGFVSQKPLAEAPGTSFHYSTGDSELLSRLVARTAGEPYPLFARRVLFDPLGMRRALIEPDAVGTPMLCCYLRASARDWARFGLLYLNDGHWQGRQILPEGWVAYSRTPAPAAKEAQYGAHFWLKVPPPYRLEPGRPQLLPDDAFHAVGHGAQFVTIVPSLDLVVVRLGLALDPEAWDHEAFVHDLIATLPRD